MQSPDLEVAKHRHMESKVRTTGKQSNAMPHNLFQQQDVIPAPPAGISVGEKALKVKWGKLLLWEMREAEVGGEEQAAGDKSRESDEPGSCIKYH